MAAREKTCCFIGHRHVPEEDLPRLRAALEAAIRALAKEGVVSFCCGGGKGFESVAAEAVLRARARDGRIRLVLLLPCREPAVKPAWPERRRLERLKRRADRVSYVQENEDPACAQKQSRRLIDSSSVCVAYCYRSSGSATETVHYALQEGLKMIYL